MIPALPQPFDARLADVAPDEPILVGFLAGGSLVTVAATRGLGPAPDGCRLIPLTKGFFTVVDEADFESVASFRWFAQVKPNGRAYAARNRGTRRIYLHRLIVDAPLGLDVDHWNGDGLDNRRVNLRACTRAENLRKASPRANATGFKGVSQIGENRYQARIRVEGERRHLGCFSTATEAALAYDHAAKQWFGEFARLNFECAPVVHAQQHEPGDGPCLYSKSMDLKK